MFTRRDLFRGAGLATASLGLGVTGMLGSASSANAASEDDAPWYLKQLASVRSADADESVFLAAAAREAAIDEGYDQAQIAGSVTQSTMGVNPRGNKVGKCALILDECSVFVLTREFGQGPRDRQMVQTLWTDGSEIMRDIAPRRHAALIQGSARPDADMVKASSNCCAPLGSAVGTCCEYDFQGLLECCGPCAFTLPGGVTFLACVAIWCSYCSASHCNQWYRGCGSR